MSLQGKVVGGVGWKAVSQIVRQLTRLVVLIVVARALSPHDYGLAGMVLVFSTLVLIFSDLALGSALVQRAQLAEVDRSTVFWASSGIGLLTTAASFALAGPLAGFFGEPDVEPLLRAFSITFLLTALSTVQSALLTRDMAWRQLETRNIGATLAGAVTGIGLAVSGAGAWAIIGQQIAIAVTSAALLWLLSPWHPRLLFSLERLRDLGSFGLRLFGTRLLFYTERNADNVLVGRVLGSSALGVYSLAYNIMLVPLEQIGGPMAEVLFPAFSRMQDDLRRLRTAWLRAVRLLAAVVAPAMLLLVALAPDVVLVLLGKKWEAITPVIQLLAWVGLHQSLQRFNSSVLQAVGEAKRLLRYALLTCIVCTAGFALGLQWGVEGVAACYAIASTLVAPVYLVWTARAVQMPLRDAWDAVGGVLAAAALAAIPCWILRVGLTSAIDSPFERLTLEVVAGVGLYLLLLKGLAPEIYRELARLAPARVRDRIRRLRPVSRPIG